MTPGGPGRDDDAVDDDDDDDDEPFVPPEEVVLPVEDHLDLHAFRPRDVRDVVENYLDEASALGLAEVRLIHGRGIGVQREIVRGVLGRHPAVLGFEDAPPGRGGWGATVVRLRPGPLADPPAD